MDFNHSEQTKYFLKKVKFDFALLSHNILQDFLYCKSD